MSGSERDPRMRAHNPESKLGKRASSRSPEGSHARKGFRPHSTEATSLNSLSPQRSASSTIPPQRHNSNYGFAPPPFQSSTFASPKSTGSASTERSNPTSRASSRRPTPGVNGAVVPHVNGNASSADASESSNPVVDLLVEFSRASGQCALMMQYRDQAEAQLGRAKREYDAMRSKFEVFPAIREGKMVLKQVATDDLERKNISLAHHESAEREVAGRIAALLSETLAPPSVPAIQPTLPQSNGELASLSTEVDELVKSVSGMREELAEIKRSVRASQKSNEDLANKAVSISNEALENATRAVKVSGDAQKEAQDSRSLVLQVNKTIQPFRDADAMQLATVIKAQKSNGEEQKLLREGLVRLKNATDDLRTRIEEAKATFAAPKPDYTPLETTEVLMTQVKNLILSVNNISSEVHDDQKASVLQRLSGLELDQQQHETDLASLKSVGLGVQSSQPDFVARISEVEKHVDLIDETHAKRVQLNDANLEERVKSIYGKLDERVKSIHDAMDEKDLLIAQHIRDEVNKLQADIIELRDDHANDSKSITQRLTGSYDSFYAAVNDLRESKVSVEQHENSATETKKAHEELKAELAQKADNAAMKRLSDQLAKIPTAPPPRLPGNRADSPRVNDVHSPQTISSYLQSIQSRPNDSMQSPPVARVTSPTPLESRLNSLTDVTQRLERQYDNLTSDEVVRAMCGQMSTMYPCAKDFQQAVQRMRRDQAALQNDVSVVRVEIGQHSAFAIASLDTLQAKLDAVSSRAEAASRSASDGAGTSVLHTQQIQAMHASIKDLQQKCDSIAQDYSGPASSAFATAQLPNISFTSTDPMTALAARQEALQDALARFGKLDMKSMTVQVAMAVTELQKEMSAVNRAMESYNHMEDKLAKLERVVLVESATVAALQKVVA